MNIKKTVCLIAILWFCISQNYGQRIKNLDSLMTTCFVEKDNFSSSLKINDNINLTNLILKKYDPVFKYNLNYLKEYEYKSYNMREYYIFHRLNTTPGFLRDSYRLPPYVDHQKVEVMKKKR